jgi:hypothetical protein
MYILPVGVPVGRQELVTLFLSRCADPVESDAEPG